MTTTALRASQQRAIVHAQQSRLVRLVEPVTNDCYFVPSTSERGVWYLVSRSKLAGGTIWSCTCKGSRNGWACRHQAAAFLYEVKQSAAGGSIPSAPAAALPGVARITWTETLLEADEWLAIYGKRAAA